MHTVRRVLPYEYPKYRTHLKALDPEAQLLRFGFQIKEESLDAFCDGVEADPDNHVLFCVENSDFEFVGIGHIAFGNDMELAFSVLKEYRGQGMGDALMSRCIQYCRTHNVLKGKMICLSHNTPIKKLCAKHDIVMSSEYGETQGEIELPAPDLTAYINEQIAAQTAIFDFVIKRNPITLTNKLISTTISYPTKL